MHVPVLYGVNHSIIAAFFVVTSIDAYCLLVVQ